MKILQRALRLRAPKTFSRDFNRAERITFCSGVHDIFLYHVSDSQTLTLAKWAGIVNNWLEKVLK
jgi:hypothetical protein